MKNLKQNRNLLIIALIAVVNALGYGIIIPIIYSYSKKFGLSDFQNGLLFAIFSICQFVSTPIIGRLSDKYGRRPLLIISIAGTAISFLMMASAKSAIILFLARALDGLTAGNVPVATAVISDTTEPKDRAKGFGLIGAAFGFGFIFGPAISAFTVGIWDALPFLIAAAISAIAVLVTVLFLPETNKHMGEISKAKLFDFGKMIRALGDENVGVTLLITLFYFLAFSLFIYGFQPYTVNMLKLSPNQISLIFTMFGVVGLISQVFLVQRLPRLFGLKNTFSGSILVVALSFLLLFESVGLWMFVFGCVILALSNTMVNPLNQTILSQETDAKSQGTMLGLQSSYMSIGQIVGPIIGGVMASYSSSMPFLGAALFTLLCFGLSFQVLKRGVPKESAF
jgi:MFS family permease